MPTQHLLLSGSQDRPKTVWASATTVFQAAHSQKGRAAAAASLPEVPASPAAPLLRRLGRLLVLEEAALEQDITRWGPLGCL